MFKSMLFAPTSLQSLHRVGFPKGDLSWVNILVYAGVTFGDACFFPMTKDGESRWMDLNWNTGCPNSRHLGYCCGQGNSGQCH